MRHWFTCACKYEQRAYARMVLGLSVLMGLTFGILGRVI